MSHVSPSSCVVWPTAIWEGDGDGAGVVSQHTVSHVDTVNILRTNITSVRSSTCTLKQRHVSILLELSFWRAKAGLLRRHQSASTWDGKVLMHGEPSVLVCSGTNLFFFVLFLPWDLAHLLCKSVNSSWHPLNVQQKHSAHTWYHNVYALSKCV